MKSLRTLFALLLLMVALVVGLSAANIGAADHLDSPQVTADGRLDINDVYAFQSPENADNTVLVMTVNPLAGVVSPTSFSTTGRYYFNIDQNGDAKTDLQYEVLFRDKRDGTQQVTLVRLSPNGGQRLVSGPTNQVLQIPGGGKLTASLFDDPFFFDLTSFRDGLSFCSGDEFDFFAGFNTSAIVLEVPSEWLGPDNIGVWANTKLNDLQFDRKGRPAINTVFIPSAQKDQFNRSLPLYDQVNYRDEVVAVITSLSGDPALAEALADVLLPDILTIDTSNPAGFLNGRALADDVIDAELNLITGGAVPSDCVDSNDKAFSPTFPYLAEPHMAVSSEQ